MARLRSHITFANVMSVTAVFIALGAGAYAALSIPNDSISTKKLDFPIGADGVTKTDKVPSTGSFQTIARTKVRVQDNGAAMVMGGEVVVDNTANVAPAEVEMRVLMNGKPEEGIFTTTIPANATGTGFALLLCNENPPGTYRVELQAQGSGVTFTDRTLSVETAPQI